MHLFLECRKKTIFANHLPCFGPLENSILLVAYFTYSGHNNKMGNIISDSVAKHRTILLQRSILVTKNIFFEETMGISLILFVVGFEITDLICYFYENSQVPKIIDASCPYCKTNLIEFIGADCRHMLSCENCLEKL